MIGLSEADPSRMKRETEGLDAQRSGQRQHRGIGAYHQIQRRHQPGDPVLVIPPVEARWIRNFRSGSQDGAGNLISTIIVLKNNEKLVLQSQERRAVADLRIVSPPVSGEAA
ncbi:MAG: hypothetical protein ACMVO3_10955 [Thalassobaculum sp.]